MNTIEEICPKCKRPKNLGNSPNKDECTETDDEEGVCEAYAAVAIEREMREAQDRAYERLKMSNAGSQTSLLNAVELLQQQLLQAQSVIAELKAVRVGEGALTRIHEILQSTDLSALEKHDVKLFASVGWHQDSSGKWNCPSLHIHARENPCVLNTTVHDTEVKRPLLEALELIKATPSLSEQAIQRIIDNAVDK